jgi:hypothetical protein
MVFSISSYAQNQIKFNSINSGGITAGQSGLYGLFQTVNGVMFKQWFAGIGAGYDSYYYKTIPLFVDARRFINIKNNIFMYADAGYNFSWKNKPKEVSRYTSYNFSGGFYSDIGVGFKAKFIKKTSLSITSGYSSKSLSNNVHVVNPCLVAPCPENIYAHTYNLRRIIIKTGLLF